MVNPATNSDASAWPPWARRAVSLVLILHLSAVLVGTLAAPPASMLEQALAELFAPYHQLLDQGQSYRYYAPEPGPTPIVTATIRYGDGRPDETVRIPKRGVLPRLRYQRQLALANHLAQEFERARQITGDGANSHYARSYARHLSGARPGCVSVSLSLQSHLLPGLEAVRRSLELGRPIDLDAEEFYTVPERIGEFPCDGS